MEAMKTYNLLRSGTRGGGGGRGRGAVAPVPVKTSHKKIQPHTRQRLMFHVSCPPHLRILDPLVPLHRYKIAVAVPHLRSDVSQTKNSISEMSYLCPTRNEVLVETNNCASQDKVTIPFEPAFLSSVISSGDNLIKPCPSGTFFFLPVITCESNSNV